MTLTRRQALGQLLTLPLLASTAPRLARAQTQAFDHRHAAWTALLQRHVVLIRQGHASQLRYTGMAADRSRLQAYLGTLSAVSRPRFEGFSKAEQMAFLINAYNAFTVELILTRYPDLTSIKDLGSLLTSPWKKPFVALLGAKVTLDDIEQNMLRRKGQYDDPRIHFAVNCASIGCPMLREEAYVAERLDAQLDQQTERFLADSTRNRFNPANGRLEVSKIFDWYGGDFAQGHHGIRSLKGLLARHADVLATAEKDREAIRQERVPVDFLDYDWHLNDVPRS